MQLEQLSFSKSINELEKATLSSNETCTAQNTILNTKLYKSAKLYVQNIENVRRLVLVSKLIDSEERKIQNDKIDLKQLLPFEKKLFKKLNDKIDDMEIKIENAKLHMTRPWENKNEDENENENENENDSNNKNEGGNENENDDRIISLKSSSVDFIQSLDHDQSWIVTDSDSNSNSNPNSNLNSNSKIKINKNKYKNKYKSENENDLDNDDIQTCDNSQLSNQVNVITDRVRFFRRSIDRINDAVGMLEVGSDWMDGRKYISRANNVTIVNDENENGNDDNNDDSHNNNDKSDGEVNLNDSNDNNNNNDDNKKKKNQDNGDSSNKLKITHTEKHEKSTKTVKAGRWKNMGTFANINNENLLNAKLNELEIEQDEDEDWLLIDEEHSFEEHSSTQKSSSQKCSLLALFDKMELTKSSYTPKNINSRKFGMKVLSPLAMIGMNISESEKKKNMNQNDNENENVTDDDMVGALLGSASSPEGETAALHSFTSPSPSSSSSHSHINPQPFSHPHPQPSSIPLHLHQQQHHKSTSASGHTEYQIMENRKSLADGRSKRQNVWIQFTNTTSKSVAVVTTVSPLILSIKNNKYVRKNLEIVAKNNANNENEIAIENEEEEGGNSWYHILPHTNPHHHHHRMAENLQQLAPTHPLMTSTNINNTTNNNHNNLHVSSSSSSISSSIGGGSKGVGGEITGTKFSNLFQSNKSKTNGIPILLVDTTKPENKNNKMNEKITEMSKFEFKDTSIFSKNVIDGSTSASSRVGVDDVRDNHSRRKSSFGSRDGFDGTESVPLPSPLPSSTSTSTSLFSSPLDSHSPSFSISSPKHQLQQQQQRSSLGSPSLIIDVKGKDSNNDEIKSKLLISPEISSRKSPISSSKNTVNPTINPVTPSFLDQVSAFYLKHNPTKVEEIPKLLEKYRGQENELIRKLEKKYGVISGISSTGDSGTGTGTGAGAGAGARNEGHFIALHYTL